MAKETVRYPDALVARVEAVVAEVDAFESKSEFYRFASDFLLSVLDPEHDPTVLGYGDIVAELESVSGGRLLPDAGEDATTEPFLDAYIQVRRHLLYDDVEAARSVVADRYDATDREALLLDEVIGRERRTASAVRGREPGVRDPPRETEPVSRLPEEGPAENRRPGHPDRAEAEGTPTDGHAADDSGEPSPRPETRRRRAKATRETDGGNDTVDSEDA